MPSDRFQYLPCHLHHVTDIAAADILGPLGWEGCDVHPTGASAVPEEFTLPAGPPEGHIDLKDPLGWAFAVQALYRLLVLAKDAPNPTEIPEIPEATSATFTDVDLYHPRRGTLVGPGWALRLTGHETFPEVTFGPYDPSMTGLNESTHMGRYHRVLSIPTLPVPGLPLEEQRIRTPIFRREALCRCFASALNIDVDATWPPLPADPAASKEEG